MPFDSPGVLLGILGRGSGGIGFVSSPLLADLFYSGLPALPPEFSGPYKRSVALDR